MIKTTVNVRNDLYNNLIEYAQKYNCKVDFIIKLFIEKMINEIIIENVFVNTAMKYQEPAEKWDKPHVSFSQHEFDRILDIKKVYRLSLSLVLAMAIEKYGESIFFENNEDSYQDYLCTKVRDMSENDIKYVFCWEKPRKNTKEGPN